MALCRLLIASALILAVGSDYAVPPDALGVNVGDLASAQITSQLHRLLLNATNELTAEEDVPVAIRRLSRLIGTAQRRADQLQSSGRLLSFNRGAFFRGLLVVWLPVSFLLPTLARGRSSSSSALKRRDSGSAYDPASSEFKFDVNYGPLLSRLEAYFDLLNVDDVDCRRKLICGASADADALQPLSQLFRRLFERSQGYPRPQQYHPELKKFFTYYWASKKGRSYSTAEQCSLEYPACALDIHQLIRTDMLTFWQKLSKKFAIQLQDE